MELPISGNMAGLISSHASISTSENEDLSEQQIYQLLKDAEQRLGSSQGTHSRTSSSQYQSATSGLRERLSAGQDSGLSSYIKMTSGGAQIDPDFLVTAKQRKLANQPRIVDDPILVKSNLVKAKTGTAGANWYNIPRTKLTPELKRDLQLLRMRSVLDPKRHYKKGSGKTEVPEFSQIGTIIEGPTEFFSARLRKKDRMRTFVEEVLASETATNRFKSKYNDIQKAKTSGKKAHYKKLRAKRSQSNSIG